MKILQKSKLWYAHRSDSEGEILYNYLQMLGRIIIADDVLLTGIQKFYQ
jgi:hypothetical protein